MLVWLRASSSSAEMAVMASGVSCTFCSRNCAVTTTSWSSSSCSAAVAAAVAPAQSTTPRDARTADATDLFLDTMYPTHSCFFDTARIAAPPDRGTLQCGRNYVSTCRGRNSQSMRHVITATLLVHESRQCRCGASDVEAEMHDVAFAHDVFLAFEAQLAGFLRARL